MHNELNGNANPSFWLIKGIRLMDGGLGVDEREVDLLVGDDRIKLIASDADPSTIAAGSREIRVIQGRGLWLWPGLVDGHVHFREPGYEYKETFRSGGRAAARGGYTSVICEPNTDPPPDSAEMIAQAMEKARCSTVVRTYFKAAMTRGRQGREVSDYGSLAPAPGVAALSDDGDPVSSLSVMEQVCSNAARWRLLLSPHCEDSPRALADFAAGVDPGFTPGRAFTNETLYVVRDMLLAGKYGCNIHFSHLSLASSIEALAGRRGGMNEGVRISCEATPHHLLLSDEDYPAGDAPSVNPPLRSKRDVQALQDALSGGLIDAIASDHAPHSEEDKAGGACGLIGLETTLGLVLTYFVGPGRISPLDACRLLSSAPASVFGLPGGVVQEDAPADLVFIDPDKRWTVDPSEFESLSRNTPFAGRELAGRAVGTMVGGRFAHMDDDLKNRMINPPA